MFKELLKKYKLRNYFNPSSQEFVGSEDLVRIFESQVINSNSRDSVYFVVCSNGLEMLQKDGRIRLDELQNVVSTVFDKSEWFGKLRELVDSSCSEYRHGNSLRA